MKLSYATRKVLQAGVVCAALTLGNSSARAAIITYDFSGSIADLDGNANLGLSKGAAIKGRVSLDLNVRSSTENIPWGEPKGRVDRTQYVDNVTSLQLNVQGVDTPAKITKNVRSTLDIYNDQRLTFPDGSGYYFDRYILTIFDVPAFDLSKSLYFVQFDFYAMASTTMPTMFKQGPAGMAYPDIKALQSYIPQFGYAGGRLGPTSENRNIRFDVNDFDVLNTHKVDEPASTLLIGVALLPLYAARVRQRRKRTI